MIIDENRELTEGQRRRVLKEVRERDFTCGTCGSDDFRVGEALELGFLFLDVDHGTHMVALTCESPGCEARTGIKLHESEFLYDPDD